MGFMGGAPPSRPSRSGSSRSTGRQALWRLPLGPPRRQGPFRRRRRTLAGLGFQCVDHFKLFRRKFTFRPKRRIFGSRAAMSITRRAGKPCRLRVIVVVATARRVHAIVAGFAVAVMVMLYRVKIGTQIGAAHRTGSTFNPRRVISV